MYHHASHLTFRCLYHVVFCPKYRRKILKQSLQDFLRNQFIEISKKHDFTIVEMEIKEDHVHLLIDCNPRFGILNCVRKLKAISAVALRDAFPDLKSRLPNVWTRSSFIATVGSVSLDVVKQYIVNQKNV